jgi:hypothetical protein
MTTTGPGSAGPRSRRVRTPLVAVLAACALVAAAPPDDTFELAGDPVAVTQGDVIQLDGTCWAETIGPADQARVRLSRVVPPGSGVTPFDTSVELEVAADGSFGGGLTVPPDAPAGDHRLSGVCVFADQVRGLPTSDVTVTGEPTTTTTTTTTTATVTTTTTSAPGAAPAVAVDGEARLAG